VICIHFSRHTIILDDKWLLQWTQRRRTTYEEITVTNNAIQGWWPVRIQNYLIRDRALSCTGHLVFAKPLLHQAKHGREAEEILKKKVALVRERTIPSDRSLSAKLPPTFADMGVLRSQRGESSTAVKIPMLQQSSTSHTAHVRPYDHTHHCYHNKVHRPKTEQCGLFRFWHIKYLLFHTIGVTSGTFTKHGNHDSTNGT
jgi:hypothetical protein